MVLDPSMQILATSDEIVSPALALPEQNVGGRGPVPWQQAIRRAIRSAAELRQRLGLPAGNEASARAERSFPVFVPWEFLVRIQTGQPDDPLLRQVLALPEEVQAAAGFSADPVGDDAATVAAGLIQKYSRRALVIATGVCGVHCRYCFRREFDYSSATSPAEAWRPAVEALRERTDVDEVILSGGDPLTLSDSKLGRLIATIESIPHVKRLRIHSRMPIVIPQRVTNELVDCLRSSRLATWMVVHCNHAAEIDVAVESALGRMLDAGIPVLNQAVLLRGVNDSAEALEQLCRKLVDLRVQPYYLHQLDRVCGAAHFEVAVDRGRDLIDQLRERLPGYAVPRYVAEIAGGRSKTTLG